MSQPPDQENPQPQDATQAAPAAGESADAAAALGAPPPSSIPAEQALLGSLLHNNAMFDRLPEALRQDHFFEPLHGRIFQMIVKRMQTGHGVSPITLAPAFETDEAMSQMGGTQYLARLAGAAVSWSHVRDYANIVYDTALRRMLIDLGGSIQSMARDGAAELGPQEQVRQAEQMLYKLGEDGAVETGFRTFAEVAVDAVVQAEEKAKQRSTVSGLSSGFIDFDRKTSGLHRSDLVIIAGRTSMGKSALAMNIAFNIANAALMEDQAASDEDHRRLPVVAYFTLEMSAVQLANRILSARSGVTTNDITKGRIREDQFSSFVRAADELSQLPLYIDDTPSLDIDSLCTRARRLSRQRGLRAVFVDYLQLVEGSIVSRRDSREQRVAEVSRRFKGLAKELGVPVVALAQLSRQVESREEKTPLLSDLRESGSIEQDADLVCMIHRPEYYLSLEEPKADPSKHEEWQRKMDELHNVAYLDIAKHRNGPTGRVTLHFDKDHIRFTNAVSDEEVPEAVEAFG